MSENKITRVSTVNMTREEWLDARRHSIGGSDAGIIVGVNNYRSPFSLWSEKTGRYIPDDIAMFKTKDGGYGFEVMSVDDVRAHAMRYSKSYGSGPWQTNFDEMAKKTVLKKVLKYAPLKSDFVRAVSQDETVKTQIDADMYAVPDETVYAEFEVDETTGEAKILNEQS